MAVTGAPPAVGQADPWISDKLAKGFIFFVIGLEFGFYVFVRQIVNALEWLIGMPFLQ
jgi:hypothetical protein